MISTPARPAWRTNAGKSISSHIAPAVRRIERRQAAVAAARYRVLGPRYRNGFHVIPHDRAGGVDEYEFIRDRLVGPRLERRERHPQVDAFLPGKLASPGDEGRFVCAQELGAAFAPRDDAGAGPRFPAAPGEKVVV